jgi:hypothetical protein
MDRVHRNAIRKSWTTIVNSLTSDQVDSIADDLTEQNTLTTGMRETIYCETRTTAKIRCLLSIIQKRGPHAFQTLVDSLLRSGANHAASVLLFNTDEPDTKEASHTVRESVTCNICMENAISVTFKPCGHTFCCECGERLFRQKKCCYCYRDTTEMLRIFIG